MLRKAVTFVMVVFSDLLVLFCMDFFQGFVGALDLGGASTQISFPAEWPGGSSSNKHYYVTKKIMNKTEHLYARSYLCYGYNEAKGRFLAHLIDQQVGAKGLGLYRKCVGMCRAVKRQRLLRES